MPVVTTLQKQLRAEGILLLVAFCWGSTILVMKGTIQTIPTFQLLALRFLLASVVIAPIARGPKALSQKTWMAGALLGITAFSACACQAFGLLTTTIAKSGFITATNVILTPLAVAIVYRRKTASNVWLGVTLALLGLGMMLLRSESGVVIGDAITFLCALLFSVHLLLTDRFSQEHNVMVLTLAQVVTVGILSAIGSIFTNSEWAWPQTRDVIAILYLAVFCTAVPFLGQTAVQRYTTETRAALILEMGTAIFAALLGFVFARELLTFSQLVGAGLVLAGMLSAQAPQVLCVFQHHLGHIMRHVATIKSYGYWLVEKRRKQ